MQSPLAYASHRGTSTPLATVGPAKSVTKRQSKSVRTVLPVSQIPSACSGETSVASTTRLNCVETAGTARFPWGALGLVHGYEGEGGSEGLVAVQLKYAVLEGATGL